MKLQEMRTYLRTLFQKHHIESPEADSGLLLMHFLKLSKTQLLLHNRPLSKEEETLLQDLAKRRISGEPVRYLTGTCPFMDLEFEVNASTLIPRPDTELLVQAILNRTENIPLSLWDIGCGSGCVGITLSYHRPLFHVTEFDISQKALQTAKRTAEKYGFLSRMDFLCHDILSPLPDLSVPDVVVSNPPYIPTEDLDTLQTEVRDFEPRAALDGGEDGLIFYRHILSHIPIKPKGLMAFEIGYDQGPAVVSLMEDHGFSSVELLKDLSGQDRVVLGIKG